MLTKSARYVSSFEDWMELLLLKLKSCAFLYRIPTQFLPTARSLALTKHGSLRL